MAETILVVDDEAVNRELLQAILKEAGYEVALAGDGVTALALATAAPPDLILLDHRMPGLSGLEVCEQVKRDPATQAVPVIVVTAHGEVTHKEAALTRGADDFVTKPVKAGDLWARVSAMLKVRRIREELDRTLAYLNELEAARRAQRREALTHMLPGAPPKAPEPLSVPPILLVDDEALTRDFYSDLLCEHGFQVFAAKNGSEALEISREHPPEAAILNIMMPGMSGFEVLERLRGQDPDLPVIMLTAHPSSQNAIAALKLGASDFIVKGLEHELVVLAVHRAVRQRREVLAQRQEVADLRARIAELEGGLPNR